MTWGAPVLALRQNSGAANGKSSSKLCLDGLANSHFSATHFHRRQKLPVRQHFVVLGGPRDADISLNNVVIRSKVGIRNWPIHVIAIVARSFEIYIAEAITLPSPHQRAAPKNTQPLPGEWPIGRSTVWIFEIIDEPLVVIFHTGVALSLDRPSAHHLWRVVTILQLERGHVLGEFLRGHRTASFEQRDLQSSFGEPLRRPAAGRARADYNYVISLVQNVVRHVYVWVVSACSQPWYGPWVISPSQPSSL